MHVAVGGRAEVFRQVNEQIQSDLVRAEGLAFPITLILLVLRVRQRRRRRAAAARRRASRSSARSSCLSVIASFTEVSVFSLNLTTAMGLGLAIDYSLFIVSRYREELRNGREPHDAVVRTVADRRADGARSALTVARRAGGAAGVPAHVPPVVRLRGHRGVAARGGRRGDRPARRCSPSLGRRVDSLRILFRHREPKPAGEGVWHRIAMLVMRRPIPIATAVIAVLRAARACRSCASQFGLPDDRVLPAKLSSRQVQDDIRQRLHLQGGRRAPGRGAGPRRTRVAPGRDRGVRDVSCRALPGVARVDAVTGSYHEGQRAPRRPTRSRAGSRSTTRHLAQRRAVGRAALAGGRAARERRPRPAFARRRRARGRSVGAARRQQGLALRPHAARAAVDRGGDVRAAVPHVRQRRRAAEGARRSTSSA